MFDWKCAFCMNYSDKKKVHLDFHKNGSDDFFLTYVCLRVEQNTETFFLIVINRARFRQLTF